MIGRRGTVLELFNNGLTWVYLHHPLDAPAVAVSCAMTYFTVTTDTGELIRRSASGGGLLWRRLLGGPERAVGQLAIAPLELSQVGTAYTFELPGRLL